MMARTLLGQPRAVITGTPARIVGVLRARGEPMSARELADAVGVSAKVISAFLAPSLRAGHVIRGGNARRAAYSLPEVQA